MLHFHSVPSMPGPSIPGGRRTCQTSSSHWVMTWRFAKEVWMMWRFRTIGVAIPRGCLRMGSGAIILQWKRQMISASEGTPRIKKPGIIVLALCKKRNAQIDSSWGRFIIVDPDLCNDDTWKGCHTVDGRNPAPPWMFETHWNPINNGINHLSTGAGFLPSTVCVNLHMEIQG